MNELENCPFCGYDKIFVLKKHKQNKLWCTIYCDKCFSKCGWWPTEEDAIKAWNTRE